MQEHNRPSGPRSIERVIAALEEHGCQPRGSDERGYWALCPAHDDRYRPNLHVTYTGNKTLVHCFACATRDAIREVGLVWADLFDNRAEYAEQSAERNRRRRFSPVTQTFPNRQPCESSSGEPDSHERQSSPKEQHVSGTHPTSRSSFTSAFALGQPSAEDPDQAEFYRLMGAYQRGRIEPDNVSMIELPPDAGDDDRRFHEFLRLGFGLRRRAGEEPEWPLSQRFVCCYAMGWPDDERHRQRARRMLRRFVRNWKILSAEGPMPRRLPGMAHPTNTFSLREVEEQVRAMTVNEYLADDEVPF